MFSEGPCSPRCHEPFHTLRMFAVWLSIPRDLVPPSRNSHLLYTLRVFFLSMVLVLCPKELLLPSVTNIRNPFSEEINDWKELAHFIMSIFHLFLFHFYWVILK